jgi:hypothetical protein
MNEETLRSRSTHRAHSMYGVGERAREYIYKVFIYSRHNKYSLRRTRRENKSQQIIFSIIPVSSPPHYAVPSPQIRDFVPFVRLQFSRQKPRVVAAVIKRLMGLTMIRGRRRKPAAIPRPTGGENGFVFGQNQKDRV